MWWFFYGCYRILIDSIVRRKVKGWPISSYIAALTHQLIVLPMLWYRKDYTTCIDSSVAHFGIDLLLNREIMCISYGIHHICAMILVYFMPMNWATLLIVLEFGSSGVSIVDLTNRFHTIHSVTYALSRLYAVWYLAMFMDDDTYYLLPVIIALFCQNIYEGVCENFDISKISCF